MFTFQTFILFVCLDKLHRLYTVKLVGVYVVDM